MIDAGNLIAKNFINNHGILREYRRKSRLVLKYYNRLGWTALNLGERDFTIGLDSLLALKSGVDFPFISANIVDKDKGTPIFESYIIRTINGFNIGITGVTSSFINVKSDKIKIIDPIAALKPVLEKLKNKTDFIIVAAAIKDRDEARICNAYPEIDLLLRANSRNISRPLEKISRTYVSKTGTQGKYMGEISIHFISPELDFVDVSRIQQRLKYLNDRIKNYEKNIGDQSLEEYYKDRPGTLKVIQNLLKQRENYKAKLNKNANTLQYTNIRLDTKIPDDEEARRDILLLKKRL